MLAFMHLVCGVITWLLTRPPQLYKVLKTISAPPKLALPSAPLSTAPEILPDFCINTNDPPSILEESFAPWRVMVTAWSKTRTVTKAQKAAHSGSTGQFPAGFIIIALLVTVLLLLTVWRVTRVQKTQHTSQVLNSQANQYLAHLKQERDQSEGLLILQDQQHEKQLKGQQDKHEVLLKNQEQEYKKQIEVSKSQLDQLTEELSKTCSQIKDESENYEATVAWYEDTVNELDKDNEDLRTQVTAQRKETKNQEEEIESLVQAYKHKVEQLQSDSKGLKTRVTVQEDEHQFESETFKLKIRELEAEVENVNKRATVQQHSFEFKVRCQEIAYDFLQWEMEELEARAVAREDVLKFAIEGDEIALDPMYAEVVELEAWATARANEAETKVQSYERAVNELKVQLAASGHDNGVWSERVNNSPQQAPDVVTKSQFEAQKNKDFADRAAIVTANDKQQTQSN